MSSILAIADAQIEFSQTAQYINNEAGIISLAIDAGRWDDAEILLKALLKYVRGQQIRIDECYPHFARAYARQQLAAVERRLQIGLREVILHRPSEQPTEIVSEPIEVGGPLSWREHLFVAVVSALSMLAIWEWYT